MRSGEIREFLYSETIVEKSSLLRLDIQVIIIIITVLYRYSIINTITQFPTFNHLELVNYVNCISRYLGSKIRFDSE